MGGGEGSCPGRDMSGPADLHRTTGSVQSSELRSGSSLIKKKVKKNISDGSNILNISKCMNGVFTDRTGSRLKPEFPEMLRGDFRLFLLRISSFKAENQCKLSVSA